MKKKPHKYLLRISERNFKRLQEEADELDISVNSLIILKLGNKLIKN